MENKLKFTIISIWNCYDKAEQEEEDFGGDYHEKEVVLNGEKIGYFGSHYDDGAQASEHFIDGYLKAKEILSTDNEKFEITNTNEARIDG